MTIADDVREAWGWKGIESVVVLATNKFGNVIFSDQAGSYWRLYPEDLECEVIADSAAEYERLLGDPEFIEDWEMARLVQMAESKYGVQPAHRCFCLKMPSVLGGAYEIENIGSIGIGELIRLSGDIARQIKDLPPGSKIQLKVTD
ncbi:MAG: T6SS immunity protein Tdi1 domain-containing protein [Burkholderiales bacterium]